MLTPNFQPPNVQNPDVRPGSCCTFGLGSWELGVDDDRASLQPESLKPPVERAAAETEALGRVGAVAVVPGQGLLDEEAFDFLEAHVLDASRRVACGAQAEVAA